MGGGGRETGELERAAARFSSRDAAMLLCSNGVEPAAILRVVQLLALEISEAYIIGIFYGRKRGGSGRSIPRVGEIAKTANFPTAQPE